MSRFLRIVVPCVMILAPAASNATTFSLSCSPGGVDTEACKADGAYGSIAFDNDVPLDGTPFTSAATYSLYVREYSYIKRVTQFVDYSGNRYNPVYQYSNNNFIHRFALGTVGLGAPDIRNTTGERAQISDGTNGSDFISAQAFSSNTDLTILISRYTGNGSLSYALDSYTVSPTRLQLARMSESAYPDSRVNVVDDFHSERDVVGPDGFSAQVFKKDNQIVLAIRGTLEDGSKIELANSSSNTSFLNGTATATLKSEVSQAATLLSRLKDQCSSCEIYLTGHSLGGAIAQVLGQETGLPTSAFNAPGAADLLEQLSLLPAVRELSQDRFINSGSNENIRSYGDLISLAGRPLGSQYTISTAYDTRVNSSGPQLYFYDTHYIDTVVSALSDNLNIQSGVNGPGLTEIDRFIAGVSIGRRSIRFDKLVTSGEYWSLDPDPSSLYQLVSDQGSPLITTIAFPGLRTADKYVFSYLSNSSWTDDVFLDAGAFFNIEGGTLGIRYGALSSNGESINLPADFAPLLTFGSSGRFQATLAVQEVNSAVPEPSTWLMLIGGMFTIGMMIRKSRIAIPVQ